VALFEATNANALNRAMRPASYRPGGMAIKIASDLSEFFVIVDSMFAHNVSQRPCYGHN
jgi:hypothetical protein